MVVPTCVNKWTSLSSLCEIGLGNREPPCSMPCSMLCTSPHLTPCHEESQRGSSYSSDGLIYCLLGCLVVSEILWVIGPLVNGFIPACHTKEHKRKWVPLMASSKAILSWQMPYRDWLPFRDRLCSLYSVVERGVILAWVTCVTHQYVLNYKTVRKSKLKFISNSDSVKGNVWKSWICRWGLDFKHPIIIQI